jgi:adenine-specific DNA methylase
MAFTFHHSEDEAWVNVLEALFDAGYVLVATAEIALPTVVQHYLSN